MNDQHGSFFASYAKFVAVGFLTAVIVVGLGYMPTLRIAGEDALVSMLAGCGISWVSSCLGAIPLALAAVGQPSQAASPVLLSTGVRFLTVLFLVGPLALSGWMNRIVLVVFVGVSYLLMLVVDTAFAVRVLKRVHTPHE